MADDRPVCAVEVTGVVHVGGVRLHLVEVGDQLLEAPLVVSPLRPICRSPLGIPRRNIWPLMALDPPVTFPLGTVDLGEVGAPRLVLPVVVAVPDALPRRVAELHLFRQAVDVGVVRPRLQQKH